MVVNMIDNEEELRRTLLQMLKVDSVKKNKNKKLLVDGENEVDFVDREKLQDMLIQILQDNNI